jgi:UDPglucose 6-dehydrogenase
VVVNKSTVPVGSGDYVSMLIQEGAMEGSSSPGDGVVDYWVVSNPEFLREGSAVYDSFFPNRIVLGAEKRDALDTMRALYEPIIGSRFLNAGIGWGARASPRTSLPCALSPGSTTTNPSS